MARSIRQDYGDVLAVADAAISGFFRHLPRQPPTPEEFKACQIVAHRGCWSHKRSVFENTMEAFEEALNIGVWGIEFDVQWTLDNVPVVIHDPHTARIPGCARVEVGQTPSQELHSLCTLVPKVEDVIRSYGKRLHLMIELKHETVSTAGMRELPAMLDGLEPVEDFHLMALEPETLALASMFPAECRLLIATTDTRKKFQQTLEHEVGGLTGHYLLLTKRMRRELNQRHLKWGTGFVDSPNLLAREFRSGAQWIFTNSAPALFQQLDRRH